MKNPNLFNEQITAVESGAVRSDVIAALENIDEDDSTGLVQIRAAIGVALGYQQMGLKALLDGSEPEEDEAKYRLLLPQVEKALQQLNSGVQIEMPRLNGEKGVVIPASLSDYAGESIEAVLNRSY